MKVKSIFPKITLALIFLAIPNVNIIDVLPDCIAYFLLMGTIGEIDMALPYFAELKTSLKRLSLLTLIKIPACLIMFANLYTGSDIIPLFTLVFAVSELLLIIPTLSYAHSALSYLGERSGATSLISAFKLPVGKMSTDTLKNLTVGYFILRGLLSFLPEICLLTLSNDRLALFAKRVYPVLATCSILLSLALGIIWLTLALAYLRAIRCDSNAHGVATRFITAEHLSEIKATRDKRTHRRTLALFAASSIFSFDLFFYDIKSTSILPHFLWYVLLICVILKIESTQKMRIVGVLSLIAASTLNIGSDVAQTLFFEDFSLADLATRASAREAYLPIEILSAAETVAFLIGLFALATALIPFALKSVKIHDDKSEADKRLSSPFIKRMKISCIFTLSLMGLISLLKCVNILISRYVTLIYTNPTDVTMPTIATSALPWLSTLIFFLSVVLVLYTFHFTAELRQEKSE